MAETRGSPFGPYGSAHQPHGLDCRASGPGLLRSARNRESLSWTERWRLAGLGANVSLDRSQDSHPCFLLHARHLAAAVPSQTSSGCLERHLHGATPGRVTPDSAVRSALPPARRQGSQPGRDRALQTDPHPASSGQNLASGSVAYYPTWVIPLAARKFLRAHILIALPLSPTVNSR